jgi:long-chain fatty acid transport protein
MNIRCIGICWLGWCALALPAAYADGVFRDSVGATSSGRGGTNISHSDNGAILLSNPAGMVNVPGDGLFELGVDSLVTDLHYSDPQNSVDAEFGLSALPEVAVIFRSEDENWAAGIGVFVPAGFGAEWHMNGPVPITGPQEYRSFGALAQILPGVSARLTDRLSVGATLGLAISHAELQGPFFVQTGALQGAPTILDLEANGAALTWSVGLQYILSERTTVGLVYSSENRFTLTGNADATVFLGPPALSGFDAELELIWPQSAGVGITHLLTDRQRLSADVVWVDWSSAFDELRIELSNPTNPGFVPLSPINDALPLDWDDVISVRLGYEFFWTRKDVLRAGYIYNSQSVPDSTLTPYIPGILRHTVSAGYGRQLRNARFDAAYQFAFSDGRDVGTSGLVGGDFSNSDFDAQAHWLFFSYTKEF